jgi:hypothetical protein
MVYPPGIVCRNPIMRSAIRVDFSSKERRRASSMWGSALGIFLGMALGPAGVREWQFTDGRLEAAPPKNETMVNCFNPSLACSNSSCGKEKEIQISWKKDQADAGEKLISSCSKSKKHGELLKAKFPIESLLVGSGSVTVRIGKTRKVYFYKGVAGE